MSERKAHHTSRWIIVGLLLGVLCGLFFGEYCSGLNVIGQAYVGLLQMTVLPYLVLSLTAKMGRLDVVHARKLGVVAFTVLLILWVIGIALIVVVSGMLPPTQGASFYTPPNELPAATGQDWLMRFIPTNVFRSLSDESIPAVVLFCLAFGSALMLLPGKEPLLDLLDLCATGLGQINHFLVRLAPFGLFALTAAAAGTLRMEEMTRLQAYLLLYSLACGAAIFGIFPVLVSRLTPIGFREFVVAMQEPALIAIATGKLFVTLPQVTEKCEELLREDDAEDEESRASLPSVLVPLAYPFPHLGKTLSFVFISFAAWYSGTELTEIQTGGVAATGTISSFASPLVTMPYLLDQWQLPQDLMSLFILPGFITTRLGDVVGVAHLMALTVIVAHFLRGNVRVRWKSLATATVGLMLCLGVAIGASRTYLASTTLEYDLDERFLSLEIRSPHPDVVVYRAGQEIPARTSNYKSTMDRIREQRTIRVAYNPDSMPFTFFNRQRQLVGLDIELLHHLAERLQIRLEFIPTNASTAEADLAAGKFDLIVGGVLMIPERLVRAGLTQPYQTATLAVVARDHRRDEFDRWEDLRNATDLRLGVRHPDMAAAAKRFLPDVPLQVVDSVRPFFAAELQDFDGVIMAAEVGSVWNVLYPSHTVVVPQPVVRRPVSMVVRPDDRDWLQLLNRWLDFERMEGALDRARAYWIEGRGTEEKPPRWCVVRDVLHWLP